MLRLKHTLAGLALALTVGFVGQAHAGFLAAGSTLSLSGSDTYTSTSITFVNPAAIGGETGSFTVLANCASCVTMTSFTSSTATPFTLYTATETGPIVTSLSVSSDTFNFNAGGPDLTVTGSGTLTLTGFDPTPGTFILTTQGPTSASVTFSVTSTAHPVPEPASLAIFGAALAGLGLVRRRRRNTA